MRSLGAPPLAAAPSLAGLKERIRPTAPAGERCLPVLEALRGVLPDGLRRGTSVAVGGAARASVLLALVAGASRDGSWVAVVGVPELGLAAAAELGCDLDRLLLVATPPPSQWAAVVAALAEATDVVVVAPRHRVRPTDSRRLTARVREHGAVLVRLTPAAAAAEGRRGLDSWPEPAELWCRAMVHGWRGVGEGHGHLLARAVTLEVGGRRGAVRPRQAELWLPDVHGGVSARTSVTEPAWQRGTTAWRDPAVPGQSRRAG